MRVCVRCGAEGPSGTPSGGGVYVCVRACVLRSGTCVHALCFFVPSAALSLGLFFFACGPFFLFFLTIACEGEMFLFVVDKESTLSFDVREAASRASSDKPCVLPVSRLLYCSRHTAVGLFF